MSTIIKNLQEMWQNKSFLISEVGKIARFSLLSQAIRCRWLIACKNIPQVNMGNHMGKQPTARSNFGACSH